MSLTTKHACGTIIILAFLVFGNTLCNAFVSEDIGFILRNPEVHSLQLSKIFGPSLFNNGSYYRPIPQLYFSILYYVSKEQAFFYHFLQICLHSMNAIVLFLVYRHFFTIRFSLLLSLLFLVHPLQVESVAYIAAAASPLSFLFGSIALLLSLKREVDYKRIFVVMVVLGLSLLSKETGILFFVLIAAVRIVYKLPHKREFSIAGLVILLFYSILRFSIGGVYFSNYTHVPIAMLSFSERLLNIPAVLWYYVWSFVYPRDISTLQYWTIIEITFWNFYIPLVLLMVFFSFLCGFAGYLCFYKKPIKNTYCLFLIWFVSGILLLCQFVPLDMTVADRWFYFPLAGLLGLLGCIVMSIPIISRKFLHDAFAVLLVICIIGFAMRTILRNMNWKNNMTLYLHDTKIHTNYILESGLGTQYAIISQYEKAIFHFEKAAIMRPCEENFFNLGYTYESKHNNAMARKYYYKAMQAKSCKKLNKHHQLYTYIRLGKILLLLDDVEEAKKYISAGLVEYPHSDVLVSLNKEFK